MSDGCELGRSDVPDAAIALDGVVGAIECVDRQQPAAFDLDDARIAQIPAPAVVAQDHLPAPCRAAIGAQPAADAIGLDPITIDAGDAPVLHFDDVSGSAP